MMKKLKNPINWFLYDGLIRPDWIDLVHKRQIAVKTFMGRYEIDINTLVDNGFILLTDYKGSKGYNEEARSVILREELPLEKTY